MESYECAHPSEEQKKCDGKKNEPHKQSPYWHRQIDEALSDQRVAMGIHPRLPLHNVQNL
jgi:hypothetical protein